MYSILAKKSIIWSSFLRVSAVKCTLHCMPSLLLFYFNLHFRPDVFERDSMPANPPVLSSFQAQCWSESRALTQRQYAFRQSSRTCKSISASSTTSAWLRPNAALSRRSDTSSRHSRTAGWRWSTRSSSTPLCTRVLTRTFGGNWLPWQPPHRAHIPTTNFRRDSSYADCSLTLTARRRKWWPPRSAESSGKAEAVVVCCFGASLMPASPLSAARGRSCNVPASSSSSTVRCIATVSCGVPCVRTRLPTATRCAHASASSAGPSARCERPIIGRTTMRSRWADDLWSSLPLQLEEMNFRLEVKLFAKHIVTTAALFSFSELNFCLEIFYSANSWICCAVNLE